MLFRVNCTQWTYRKLAHIGYRADGTVAINERVADVVPYDPIGFDPVVSDTVIEGIAEYVCRKL